MRNNLMTRECGRDEPPEEATLQHNIERHDDMQEPNKRPSPGGVSKLKNSPYR